MLCQFFVITLLFHASFAETKTTNGTQNECGTITSTGRELRDVTAKRGEIPWQALIYKKTTRPYMMICGGSLVRNDVVISVAVCFWSEEEKLLPAANFAVAVGKIYHPWDNNVDEAQKSDVKEIHIPLRFFGRAANYQDDIAVVKVASPFTYNSFIKPVCLSFDAELDNQQLQAGNEGKIGTWGVHETGQISPVLHVSNLPYIDIQTCVSKAPAEFHPFITSDKFCAGTLKPNSGLCRGDSGTGLSFPSEERYYLQGIASVGPVSSGGLCGDHGLTAFTTIRAHEDFIKQHLTEIERKPAA